MKPGSAEASSIAKDIAKDKFEIEAVGDIATSGSDLLINILRALFVRAVFIVHSLTTIWLVEIFQKV